MTLEDIRKFCEMMGGVCQEHGETVRTNCPFAEWDHDSGVNTKPAFAIKVVEEGGGSPCQCFSCGYKGTMWGVGRDLVERGGKRFEPVRRFLRRVADCKGGEPYETTPETLRIVQSKKSLDGPIVEYPDDLVMGEECYRDYSGAVPRYALDRGLKLSTCREWELGHDPWMKRLLFPVRDYRGRLVGVSGRLYYAGCAKCFRSIPRDSKHRVCVGCGWPVEGKYKHTEGFKKEYVLFGEHKINGNLDVAIIVEGPLDALHLWQFGYDNVLALQGSDPSVKQLRKLIHFFRSIVVFVDADKAGKKLGEKMAQKLWDKMENIWVVGGEKDDGKDPAERSQAEVFNMLRGYVSPVR